jgi:hypothetical protein
MQKIIDFWTKSYRSDQTAFWLELISFIFTVAGSLYLAVNAAAPDMRYVYPAFLIGASTGCYAAIRRGAAWISLVTAYFTVINVFGFGRAMLWW